MSKPTKNKLVPALRFPEFKNDGEWTITTIEDNCSVKGRIGYRGYTTEDLVENGQGAFVLGGKHIQNQVLDLSEPTFLSWDKYYESPEIMVEIGDIIFSQRGTLGDCAIIERGIGPATINPSMVLLKNINCDAKFLYYILIGEGIQKEVQKNSTSSAVPMLSQKQIKEFPFYIPSLGEQQKIADCLSSLDELIAAEGEKLDALKDHKKGLMQQLFPAEGKTVPALRFPGFKGEWAFEEFAQYIKLYRGSSPRPIQNYFTADAEGVNWIKIGDTKNADNFIINQVEEKITLEGAEKSRKVYIGELILANSMSFGKTYELAIEGYIYDGWFVLREYEEHFDKHFLLQLLNSDYMQVQYNKLSAGGIVQNISSDIVYNTILPYTSIKEQQKIAECLSAVDELITTQADRVDALKEHKKGLMQQLFPSPNG